MSRIQMVVAALAATEGGASVVAHLMQVSRLSVEGTQVTGALLFDGERLVQLMDGPPATVLGQAQCWCQLPELLQARVVAVCSPPCTAPVLHWQTGFVDAGPLDAAMEAADPLGCVQAFVHALSLADVF